MASPIGAHPLRDCSLACGIGLAFGNADARSLEWLVDAAAAAGASGFRAAAGRILMTIGLTAEAAPGFVIAAEQLGFITRADDLRRRVIACAGAPVCASAHIASRALAPLIAAQTECVIHISGCAKGCAHAASAALTIVGTADGCALVANGSARDAPFAIVPTGELPAAIAKFMHEAGHV
jgi:precorrin-3B synthase